MNLPLNEPSGPRPRAFVVGAPRCGTTALITILRQHPQVFVPYVKEPHFFGADLTTRRGFTSVPEYLQLFAEAGDRLAIEGSTWYLYSTDAASEIRDFDPQARIIVMIRNPVDVMHSWHAYAVLLGEEPIEDFEEALAAEPDRRAGRRLPDGTPPEHLFYRQIPCFAEQIERYAAVFERSQIHVVVHDDFRMDNAGIAQDTFRFLGVDSEFRPTFSVVNSNAAPKSRTVQRVLEHQPEAVRAVVRAVTSRRVRHRLRHKIRRLNRAYRSRAPMDPALRRRLTEEFAPEVKKLSSLLGRDLSAWQVVPQDVPKAG